ncbi:MAG TPA: GtrA family protein [Streptosporangiaceae bacterium]|nr:GtrA family protein [Streptosporangiaceae bacterium]
MSSIRELYGRFRHLIHEGGKFIVVGGIGTIVTFAVANALPQSHKYIAVTVATVVATVITYIGNRFWTFKHRQGQGTTRESAIFFILNGVGLLIYYACIWLIQDVAGLKGKLWYNAALVIGTGLGTLFRFWSYRKWVWLAPGSLGLADAGESGGRDSGPGPEQERLTPADAPQGSVNQVNGSTDGQVRHVGSHRRN